jgi:DNA-binding XRE family transcriptional regulator
MCISEFYKTYNLGRERFASIIGAGKNSLVKYEKGDPSLSVKTKKKIETAMRIIEDNRLIHPSTIHNFDPIFSDLYRRVNKNNQIAYEENFRRLLEREG